MSHHRSSHVVSLWPKPVLHECLCTLDVGRGSSDADDPLRCAWLWVVDHYITRRLPPEMRRDTDTF